MTDVPAASRPDEAGYTASQGGDQEPPVPAQGWERLADGWQFALLTSIPVLGIAYLLRVPAYLGYVPWREQYVSLVLGVALGAVFIRKARAPGGRLGRVLQAAGSVLGLGCLMYTAWRWPTLSTGRLSEVDYVVGFLVIVLVIEASRHTVGRVLFVVGLGAIVYGVASNWLPGMWGANAPWDMILRYLYTDSAGVIGSPVVVTATVVLVFILFGAVLFTVGGGDVFVDLAMSVVGRLTGGSAKASVVASSLFGSVSGSAVSNVVTTGALTIPLMKRTGYPPHVAAGIEAVASTGGQLLPPVMGITAFLIADFLAVPYSSVALAAVLPALLVYLCLYAQVHLEAGKAALRKPPDELPERPRFRDVLPRVWLLFIPMFVVVYGLFWTPAPTAQVALYGTASAAICGVIARKGRVSLGWALGSLHEAGKRTVDLLVITAVAGVVIGVLSVTGLAFDFTNIMQMAAGGRVLVILLLTGLSAMVLGMGMPTVGVYILLAVTAAPAIVAAGVPPMAAHMFVLYYGMLSMVTPPICIAAFAAAPLADAPAMRTGYAAMMLATPIYILPFVFVYSPALVLVDPSWTATGLSFASAAIGLLVLAVVLTGFWRGPVGVVPRILLGVCAVLLVWPTAATLGLQWSLLINVALVCALVVVAVLALRRRRVPVGQEGVA